MWIGGGEESSEGAEGRSEGETLFRQGEEEKRGEREEGQLGVCCNRKRGAGKKSCYCVVHFP